MYKVRPARSGGGVRLEVKKGRKEGRKEGRGHEASSKCTSQEEVCLLACLLKLTCLSCSSSLSSAVVVVVVFFLHEQYSLLVDGQVFSQEEGALLDHEHHVSCSDRVDTLRGGWRWQWQWRRWRWRRATSVSALCYDIFQMSLQNANANANTHTPTQPTGDHLVFFFVDVLDVSLREELKSVWYIYIYIEECSVCSMYIICLCVWRYIYIYIREMKSVEYISPSVV